MLLEADIPAHLLERLRDEEDGPAHDGFLHEPADAPLPGRHAAPDGPAAISREQLAQVVAAPCIGARRSPMQKLSSASVGSRDGSQPPPDQLERRPAAAPGGKGRRLPPDPTRPEAAAMSASRPISLDLAAGLGASVGDPAGR